MKEKENSIDINDLKNILSDKNIDLLKRIEKEIENIPDIEKNDNTANWYNEKDIDIIEMDKICN